METVTLNNGVVMPKLGFGVYLIPKEDTERCVLDAISVGYRSFDTAQIYHNEEELGNAIKKSGIDRKEFFITTKVWFTKFGYEKAKASIDESLKKLQMDYVDLLLLHHPYGDYPGAWRALEEANRTGKARAIGLSNFTPDRLADLCHYCEIKPAVNQVETHVYWQQVKNHKTMLKYGVQHESWGPFVKGTEDFFKDPVMNRIGKAHNKSAAQVALRFLLDEGVVVIPKSTHKERMAENFNVFDFKLTEEEMKEIRGLDKDHSYFFGVNEAEFVEYRYEHMYS